MIWPFPRWRSMDSAPCTGQPVLVWDEYYLMRIARWEPRQVAEIYGRQVDDDKPGHWVQDLPYGDDPGRGEVTKTLWPVLWRPLPRVPWRKE